MSTTPTVTADLASYFDTARKMMVDSQLRPNKVSDAAVLAAFRKLPREAFLPAELAARAYADEAVRLAGGRALLSPMVLARLIQAADIVAGERVLVVGAATGYGTAVIAASGAKVVAVEQDAALLAMLRPSLAEHAPDAVVVEAALASGCPAFAPYDCIFIEGAAGEIPEGLLAQLAPTGRIAAIRPQAGKVCQGSIGLLSGGALSFAAVFDCAAQVLPGLERQTSFAF